MSVVSSVLRITLSVSHLLMIPRHHCASYIAQLLEYQEVLLELVLYNTMKLYQDRYQHFDK